jgi:hypothetical protein
MANRLLEFEAIRERICGIRIKGRFWNSYITISAHVLTEEEKGKEALYDNFEAACSRAQRYDTLIAIGNFTGKLGKENVEWQVTCKYTLHDVTSGNWVMLTQFAVRNILVITSRKNASSDLEKSDLDVLNQTDHVLVAARHSSSMTLVYKENSSSKLTC